MKHRKFFGLLALVAACGGGGGAPVLQTAALRGVVYELDGQTVDRSGVVVTVLGSGQSRVTGPDGRFSFQGLAAGGVTLRFGATFASAAHEEGGDREEGGGDGVEEGHDGVVDDRDGGDGHDGEEEGEEEEEEGEEEGEDGRHEEDGEEEEEHEEGMEDGECEDGEWRVGDVEEHEEVEVRVAIRDGRVVEFRVLAHDRMHAEAALRRAEHSPDADVEGEVHIVARADGDRFAIEVENLDAEAAVDVFLGEADGGVDATFVGSATARAGGCAEFVRESPDLPLDAARVGELSGLRVEVRLAATGELLLFGEVPDLPDPGADPGMPPREGDDARGSAPLRGERVELEGRVEIRTRPDHGREVFLVEVEGLAPGAMVSIQVETAVESGIFVTLATLAADVEGEVELEMSGALPLGVARVADLVGRRVRVISAEGTAEILLAGTIPPLVAE